MGRESCTAGLGPPHSPRVTQSFLLCGGGCSQGSLHQPGRAGLPRPHSSVVVSLARCPLRSFPMLPHSAAAPVPSHPTVARSRRNTALPCGPLSQDQIKPRHTMPVLAGTLQSPLWDPWSELDASWRPCLSSSSSPGSSHPTTQLPASCGCLWWNPVFPGCFGKRNSFISLTLLSFPTGCAAGRGFACSAMCATSPTTSSRSWHGLTLAQPIPVTAAAV